MSVHKQKVEQRIAFIKKNPDLTGPVLAAILDMSVSNFYNFCLRYGLTYKRRFVKKKIEVHDDEYFRVDKRKNWLV